MKTTVGDLRRLSVTLSQAAQVLDVDVRQVRRAVDGQTVAATIVTRGKQQIRTLNGVDVLCLRLGKVLERTIRDGVYLKLQKASDQKSLGNVLDMPGTAAGPRDDTNLVFPLVLDVAAKTVSDIQSLDGVSRLIDGNGDIRGADVEAHRIAALVGGGMSVGEVLEDYPNLDTAQVDAAVRYAEANPKPGRPFPKRTVKSVLRNGGGGGLAAAFAAARAHEEDV